MKLLSVLLLLSLPVFASATPPVENSNEGALVHVYRPRNFVGFGWIFSLKANGEKVAKVKNGRHIVLQLPAGETQLEMYGDSFKINLESGEEYFLRASLRRNMLLGKPELVEVTESFAKNELKRLKKE